MPMAAIEALVALLAATPSSTAMETVETVQAQARHLLAAFPNPYPLKAGTDLFQQMLQRSLRGQAGAAPRAHHPHPHHHNTMVPGFDETRRRLVTSNRQFVAEAKRARDTLAARGARLVRDGATVLTTGGSRAVTRLLLRAAAAPLRRAFAVLYVLDGHPSSAAAAQALEDAGLRVTRVGAAGAAHAMRHGVGAGACAVDLVLVGTEVLCGNGGLLARRGTYQLALLAKALGVRFVAAAETHKIVRGFPLVSLEQFGVTDEGVDYTPPDLIEWVITEDGIKKPVKMFDYILELFM